MTCPWRGAFWAKEDPHVSGIERRFGTDHLGHFLQSMVDGPQTSVDGHTQHALGAFIVGGHLLLPFAQSRPTALLPNMLRGN